MVIDMDIQRAVHSTTANARSGSMGSGQDRFVIFVRILPVETHGNSSSEILPTNPAFREW
jgi:hypothetical protein